MIFSGHVNLKQRKALCKNGKKVYQQLISIFTPNLEIVSSQNNAIAKLNIIRIILKKHKTNMKMLWTGIKSIINLKAKHQLSPISHLKSNDLCVTDPVKIFNHYFVNVGSNIDKKIPRTKKSPLDYLKKIISNSLFYHLLPPKKQKLLFNPKMLKRLLAATLFL